ncbi:MAG: M56 family metallopeptidase [Ekhidna sp.]
MIIYIVEFSILHLLFFGIYKVMLAKETQLEFLRFFLVGSTLLSLLLPLIEIPTKASIPTFDARDIEAFILPMITTTSQEFSLQVPWHVIIIGIVSTFFCLKLVVTLGQIYGWYKQSETDSLEEIDIRKVPGLQNSFTFLRWIFIDPKNFEHPGDILRHEQGHAKKLHSLDLLFFHLIAIFFWWLPSVWLMLKELKAVHEFEADDYALKINDKTYTKTLVQCTLKAHGMDLASSFDDAPIFNRLNFMKKMKKKISIWKVASISALVVVSGAMFACEEELEAEIVEIIEESNQQTEYSDDVQAALNQLMDENPGEKYAVVETLLENKESIEKLNTYNSDQIEAVFVDKSGDAPSVTMIVNQASELFDKAMVIQEQRSDALFTIVETPAKFPGGITALSEYLGKNMQYPEQAQRLGVEGTVVVQFVVEQDGSITNAEVLRGIGAGCDAEAMRVMKESPKWIPGTQRDNTVRQKMIQKISFKLPS